MVSTLEKLRRQPKAVRDRYAVLIAFGVTFCIAIVWGINTSVQFSNILEGHAPVQQTAAAGTNFFSQFKQLWQQSPVTKLSATTTPTTTPVHTTSAAWSTSTKIDIGSLLQGSSSPTTSQQEIILIGTTTATSTATNTMLQ